MNKHIDISYKRKNNIKMILNIRKKPLVIQCIQFTGDNFDEIYEWTNKQVFMEDDVLYIKTLEGNMKCAVNSYVTRGIKGEFYAIEKSIFDETYDILDNVHKASVIRRLYHILRKIYKRLDK